MPLLECGGVAGRAVWDVFTTLDSRSASATNALSGGDREGYTGVLIPRNLRCFCNPMAGGGGATKANREF